MTMATVDEPNGAVALQSTDATRSLAEWAGELEAAHRIGKALCSTSFVPKDFRNKPDECAAAILTGAAMGLPPTTALQMMHVINGRVGMYAKAQVALLKSYGHDVWTVEMTDESVTVAGKRKEWPENRIVRVTITMAQAKHAGWTTNQTYAKTPMDMLYARAATRVCGQVAPERLYGIPAAEEIADLPPIAATAAVDRPRPATLAEIVAPAAAMERQVDFATEDEAEPLPPRMISNPQSRKLHALFKEANLDRPSALAYCTDVLHKTDPDRAEVGSTKELHVYEAAAVIDALEAFIASEQPPGDGKPDPWAEPIADAQPELEA